MLTGRAFLAESARPRRAHQRRLRGGTGHRNRRSLHARRTDPDGEASPAALCLPPQRLQIVHADVPIRRVEDAQRRQPLHLLVDALA